MKSTVASLREEITALKKEFATKTADRKKLLELAARAYVARREGLKVAPRPWWAIWRRDWRAEAVERYHALFDLVENETLRQAGLSTAISHLDTSGSWATAAYTWQGPADMRTENA